MNNKNSWQERHNQWIKNRGFNYVIPNLIEELKKHRYEAYWQEIRLECERNLGKNTSELTEAFKLEIEEAIQIWHRKYPYISIALLK